MPVHVPWTVRHLAQCVHSLSRNDSVLWMPLPKLSEDALKEVDVLIQAPKVGTFDVDRRRLFLEWIVQIKSLCQEEWSCDHERQ